MKHSIWPREPAPTTGEASIIDAKLYEHRKFKFIALVVVIILAVTITGIGVGNTTQVLAV